jgi:outer membrane protein assembly factor BamB
MVQFLIVLATLGPAADASPNWPGFLADGTNRTSSRNLPLRWSPDQGIAWRADIPGYGQSSPVVWGHRVFVTSIEGKNKERCLVHAFDTVAGSRLWTCEFEAGQKKAYSHMVSRAAPTPAVDARGLYVFFESGDVTKFSHDGDRDWTRSLVKEYGEFQGAHGIGSSLAQTNRAIFVLADHEGPSYLLALDKANGRTLWKADRESRVSWTSPIAVSDGNRTQIIVSSGGSVRSYDAASGTRLWTLEGISGNTIPSASVAGDRLLIGAGVARTNPDEAAARRSNCCLNFTVTDGDPGFELAWRATRATSSFATPLAHRDCAYFINEVGVLFCLDLATGEQHYAQRIAGPCWASPLGAGDYVYCFTKGGVTTVIKARPKFEVVATNRLWRQAADVADTNQTARPGPSPRGTARQTSPAMESSGPPSSTDPDLTVHGVAAVDHGFFVRTGNNLYCIRGDPAE